MQAYANYQKNGTAGSEDAAEGAEGAPAPAPALPPVEDVKTPQTEEERKKYGKIYGNVWTKESHGGRYKISVGPGTRSGYDALEQHPDGRAATSLLSATFDRR